MPSDKQQKMLSSWKGIMEVLSKEMITAEDFTKAFAVVVQLIKELKTTNANELQAMQQFLSKMKSENVSEMSSAKNEMMDYCVSEMKKNNSTFAQIKERSMESIDTMFRKMDVQGQMDKMSQEHAAMMAEYEAKTLDKQKMIEEVITKMSKTTAEEEKNLLETLKGDDRLDSSAIKGLDEAIQSRIPQRVQTPAKSYQVNKADVSAQCDGANKTFTVGGSHFGIMGVFGTDFPQIYRPIIDYTETRTGVLLTSAVPAPNSGATLVIQFLK